MEFSSCSEQGAQGWERQLASPTILQQGSKIIGLFAFRRRQENKAANKIQDQETAPKLDTEEPAPKKRRTVKPKAEPTDADFN